MGREFAWIVTVSILGLGCSDDGADRTGNGDGGAEDPSGGGDADGDGDPGDNSGGDSDPDGDGNLNPCPPEDYDGVGTVCYIDSVGGDDGNTGLSEADPVQSPAAIPSDCVVAKYKRGSRFEGQMTLPGNVQVHTHYGDETDPLPKFIVPTEPMSGPVVQGMMSNGVTLDGLYIGGARGDGTMNNLMAGICIFLGSNSKVLNCEITSCDIGAMMVGEGSLFQGNYVHDLIMGVDAAPGIDPNLVGGAEGIFINASNNEVAYNTFVNCQGPAEWVGGNGGCDGGATEITVSACETMTNIKIHHNYSYNNCGFLEIASGFGDCVGTLQGAEIYHNINVDSAWMGLLQVNNTKLTDVHYYNNTSVQHADTTNAGLLWILYTDTSSGMEGDTFESGDVLLTNNLFVFDDVNVFGEVIDERFQQVTNLVISTNEQDPGFVNVDGIAAADFNLTSSSPAVNAGTVIPGNTLDFMNNTITDPSGQADIGAFEYGSGSAECLPPRSP